MAGLNPCFSQEKSLSFVLGTKEEAESKELQNSYFSVTLPVNTVGIEHAQSWFDPYNRVGKEEGLSLS